MTKFPEIQAYNRFQADLDEVSIMSDVSSTNSETRTWRKPFVPYRIDEKNMNKMDSLFEKGYASQLAASLPTIGMMSNYGYTQQADENEGVEKEYKYEILEGYRKPQSFYSSGGGGVGGRLNQEYNKIIHERDNDEDDDDDGDSSASSSQEFGNRSEGEDDLDENNNDNASTHSLTISDASNPSFNSNNHQQILKNNKSYNSPKGTAGKKYPSLRDELTKKNSFLMNFQDDVSVSSLSTKRKVAQDPGAWRVENVSRRPKTSSALAEQLHHHQQPSHSYNLQTKEMSKTMSSPFRLGQLNPNQGQRRTIHGNNNEDDEDSSVGFHSQNDGRVTGGSNSSRSQANSIYSAQSLDRLPMVSAAPHRMIQQLKTADPSRTGGQQLVSRSHHGSRQSSAKHMVSSSEKLSRPLTQSSTMNRDQNYMAGLGSSPFFTMPERATAQTPLDIYRNKKFSQSIQQPSLSQSNRMDQFLQEIDPFGSPSAKLGTSANTNSSPNKLTFGKNIHPPSLRDDGEDEQDEITSDIDEHEQRRKSRNDTREFGDDEIRGEGEDWDSSDEEMNDYYTKLVETEIEVEAEKTQNPFLKIKRLRIRAEKLIDNKFIHALFVKKMSIQDTQDLIQRMENIIYLLDPQETGYITFEQFMKIIMGVAPKHVLKSNIIKFFEYQTDNMSNLIDYQEFLISGKVLILTKLQKLSYEQFKKKVNTNALQLTESQRQLMNDTKEVFSYRNENQTFTSTWLKRQKAFVNDPSTLTWKNHLKWYSKRKSEVIIWLIRRGRRALEYEWKLKEAAEALQKLRWRAFAITDLMALGNDALLAQKQREEAKKHLAKRVKHARNYIRTMQLAYEYLKYVGLGAIKDYEYYEKHYLALEGITATTTGTSTTKTQQDALKMKQIMKEIQRQKLEQILKKKINVGNLWKVQEVQKLAIKFLRQKAVNALKHSAKQDIAQEYILDFSKKVMFQLFKKEKIRRELFMIAEKAFNFCLLKDQTLLSLLRIGAQKKRWYENQIDSREWLLEKGQSTKVFVQQKYAKGFELIEFSRKILNFMNQREFSFEYLSKRCENSTLFLIKKQEAIEYLRERPKGLWAVFDRQNEVQLTLAARGKRAVTFMNRKKKAFTYLQVDDFFIFLNFFLTVFFLFFQYIASRAMAQHRKAQTTYQELCQIGMVAKYEAFKTMVYKKTNPRLYQHYVKEKKLIYKNDLRIMKNYQNYFNNKNKPKSTKLPPTQEQRRQSQGVVPFEPKFPGMEDEKNGDALDYSSKVLTIQTLSAKLNGLEDQGTMVRSASMSPSRRLGTSGGSIRGLSHPMSALSGEFQEVLTEEREGEEEGNQQLLLQSAFGDNESEKGTNTFALTQVNQQQGGGGGAEDRQQQQQQLVPFDSINENPDNDNSNALVSRPLSPSRPITSSSTARRPRTSSASTRDTETPFTIMIQNIVKLEFIEMFQLISSIYTPSNVLLKNQLQKLELILPNVEEMRATHGNTMSPNKKNKKGSRPTSSSPVRSRPVTANNNTLQDPSQQQQQQQLVPFSPSSTTNIPSSVPLQPQQSMVITSLAADTSGTNAQYDIIGKYGFMKLMNSGKLLNISEFEVKEIFRNLDIKSSCYVNISNIYFHLWKELKKKNKLIKYLMAVDNNQNKSNNNSRPGTASGLLSLGASSSVNNQFTKSLPQNRIIMNEIVTPEERAIMILYKRMMRDDAFFQSLLEKDDNKGKLSAYEEYRLKMLKLQEKYDEDEDSDEDYNYGDEEEDEELLMADIERLKKMDVGRLMKYLTRRKVVKPQPVSQITDQENNSKPQSTTNSKPPSRAVSRPLSPVVPVSRPISRPTSPLVPAGNKPSVEKKV
jgi:hypothetical protein